MTGRHIAVVTNMGNGHVYPILGLCAELVKRGHRVTFVTNEQYARTIFESGAEPVEYRSKPISREMGEKLRTGLEVNAEEAKAKAAFRLLREHFFADAVEMLSQVERFYHENAPHLVLYDRYSVAGRVLAMRLSVPTVQVSAHFAYYKDLAVRENGVCKNPEFIVEWSKDWDTFLWEHGITTRDNYWHVEHLNIHFIPKEFQHHPEYFDERFCFTGALLNRPIRRVWKDRSNGKPIILISGMSALRGMPMDYSRFYRAFIDALDQSGCHCILSTGPDVSLGSVPGNFEINEHASHLEILPHASLLICHAGMGSTLEAAYYGVPTLLAPVSVSCGEVAYRAQELGLGVTLPSDMLSTEKVAETVRTMLGDVALRQNVKEMGRVFGRSGGAELAATRIESCLS